MLAVLAVGLLFLLPGGPAWAQDAGTIEYPENGTGSVATFTAVDPEGTAIASWMVDGTDADAFTIEGGVLRFAKTPDYETPADIAGTAAAVDNMYEITVQAMDSTGETADKAVMVEVTNVDEDGTVTLSARQPLINILFTAELTDPDGNATNPKWQWAKSRSKNGSYTGIDGAEAATYTPTDASGKSDAGYHLRVTVSYTDPQGSGKSAMMKSEYTVRATRVSNSAPEFAAAQDPTMEGGQADAAREVAENTEAGTDIGAPVVATDADSNDLLTYTLTGADADSFDIDWATGQIMTKAGLDFESTPSYTVVVRATDPAGVPQVGTADADNSDVVTVVITVTDVNEAPAVAGGAAVTFNEDTGDITMALGDAYMATDPDTDAPTPTWSVAGPDGGKFTAVDGELNFKAKPDYENATDANTDNVYEVTVQASDGKLTGMRKVKVTVENAEEAGVVTLSKTQPRVGIAVTASLTDPDGSISSLTWQWSNRDGDIEDANSDTYKPVTGDVASTLTATASYTDGHGPSKTAEAGSANIVEEDTRNKTPAFGDQDTLTDGVQNTMATRKVDENTEAVAADDAVENDDTADNVGGVVMATDPDPNAETPTYTLGGADAAKFRVRSNGQIEVGAGTKLDYETKTTYMVTLTAEDSFGSSSSIAVTIMVNPIDEVPEIMLGGLAISGMSSVEYAENGMDAVATYTAAGPNADMATWTLAGDDAGAFNISSSGELTFASVPDYENAADADTDNVYMVTVEAGDRTYMDTHEVTVTVTNAKEPGTATLSSDMLIVGEAVTAKVTDPDMVTPGTEMWHWAKAATVDGNYTKISGATAASYTPVDADAGKYLRALVTYDDGYGADAAKATVTDVMTSNRPPAFDMATTSRDVAENSEAGAVVGDVIVATDPDNDDVTYALSDATDFSIHDTGLITVGQGTMLDFETRTTYTVTVTATDPSGETATIEVTINVTNVEETGTVTLSSDMLIVGEAVTATVTDPDVVTAGTEMWQWAGADDAGFTMNAEDIEGATMASYTPVEADAGMYLRATVSYTDAHGAGKSAMSSAIMVPATGGTLLERYDADFSGAIDKPEMIQAINDYLFGSDASAISKEDMIEVINLYLFD